MIKMHRFIMIRRCRKNGAAVSPRGFRAHDAKLNYRLMKLPGEMKSLSARARDISATLQEQVRSGADNRRPRVAIASRWKKLIE